MMKRVRILEVELIVTTVIVDDDNDYQMTKGQLGPHIVSGDEWSEYHKRLQEDLDRIEEMMNNDPAVTETVSPIKS